MKLKEQVIVQRLGNIYVAYDNNHSVLHEFNEVGYKILKLIEKGKTKKEAVNEVAKEFEVKKTQVLEDVDEFLLELEKKDLITL